MQVLIVGSPDHPEVTATKGWAGEHAYVASSGEEAAGILRQLSEEEAAVFKNRHLFVVAQTTIRKEEFAFSQIMEQVNTMIGGQCRDKGLNYECRIKNRIDDYFIGHDTKRSI